MTDSDGTYVLYDTTVEHGGRSYPVSFPVPCIEYATPDEPVRITVSVVAEPRERRETALVRDADGQMAASYQEVC